MAPADVDGGHREAELLGEGAKRSERSGEHKTREVNSTLEPAEADDRNVIAELESDQHGHNVGVCQQVRKTAQLLHRGTVLIVRASDMGVELAQ